MTARILSGCSRGVGGGCGGFFGDPATIVVPWGRVGGESGAVEGIAGNSTHSPTAGGYGSCSAATTIGTAKGPSRGFCSHRRGGGAVCGSLSPPSFSTPLELQPPLSLSFLS